MSKLKRLSLGVLVLFCFTGISLAQEKEQGLFSGIKIREGIGVDYFSRTVGVKDEQTTTKINTFLLTLNTEFNISEGFSLEAILGYSLSNFNDLPFRKLPVSLELDVGSIGGLLGGFFMSKRIIQGRNFEINAAGKVLYYKGLKQQWPIPGLSVDGTANGKPSWLNVQAGPVFTYTGFVSFLPYFNISYNKLWANFIMDETIQELSGSEEKKLIGKSNFSLAFGFIYEVSSRLEFKFEGLLLPHSDFKSADYGTLVRLIYVFH